MSHLNVETINMSLGILVSQVLILLYLIYVRYYCSKILDESRDFTFDWSSIQSRNMNNKFSVLNIELDAIRDRISVLENEVRENDTDINEILGTTIEELVERD